MREDLAARERKRLAHAFPALALDTSQVPARVSGIMWLLPELGFSIDLEVPDNYPRGIPKLWCNPREITWEIDRHVFPNGMACLCVCSEYRMHWPPGSDLTAFLRALVRPYLVGQAYYQDHGHWPPGHERSHGIKGIVEAYRDLLAPIGPVSELVIENFSRLLALPSHPSGHEPCPCGSNEQLRDCHQAFLMDLRLIIDPEHAKADWERLSRSNREAAPAGAMM